MIDGSVLYDAFRRSGVRFFSGVPDSVLSPFVNHLCNVEAPDTHVIAANEGAALGLAAGHFLATGGVPVVYLQNSGLGNMVNPLLSLAHASVYGIPAILLIGWRGGPSKGDEPQHRKQGAVTEALLDLLDVPRRVLSFDETEPSVLVAEAVDAARARGGPVAILVERECISGPTDLRAKDNNESSLPSREAAIEAIVESLESEDRVVASTGMIGRELYAVRLRRAEPTCRDFLNVGAMGHATAVAVGIALARPTIRVVCLDGDGALLMHLGSLAVQGALPIPNYLHIILNNASHDSVGGQPTAAVTADLCAVAAGSGYRLTRCVASIVAIREFFAEPQIPGPVLLEVRVRRGHRTGLPRPNDNLFEEGRKFAEFCRR